MLIEVKVKVVRVIDGKTKKKSETYVIDEEFFANAEYAVNAILTEEQQAGEVTDFDIVSLRQSSIKEIDEQSLDNTLPSFVATMRDVYVDDDGNEAQLKYKVLIWAADLTAANTRAHLLSHQGYDMLVEGIKQVDYIYLNTAERTEV